MDEEPASGGAPWTVYMLVNDDGHTYVGITTDVTRRVRQHNGAVAGGARCTRGRGTWQVVYVEEGFAGRAAAQSREYYLKRDRALRRRLAKAALPEPAPA
jgi:putative endonuclease